MTTGAMVLGAVPLRSRASAPGAESRTQIGW